MPGTEDTKIPIPTNVYIADGIVDTLHRVRDSLSYLRDNFSQKEYRQKVPSSR